MTLPSLVIVHTLVYEEPMGSDLVASLSKRKIEVLRLLAQGLANKDTAEVFFLTIQA